MIEAEILRPFNIAGKVRRAGEIVTLSKNDFQAFANRPQPLVKRAGQPIDRQKYEIKTPQPPKVDERGNGWFDVTYSDGRTERVRGASTVNAILEAHASQS